MSKVHFHDWNYLLDGRWRVCRQCWKIQARVTGMMFGYRWTTCAYDNLPIEVRKELSK